MADVAPANPSNVNPFLDARIKSFLDREGEKEPKVILAAHEVVPVGMFYHVAVLEDGADVCSNPYGHYQDKSGQPNGYDPIIFLTLFPVEKSLFATQT